MQRADNQFTRPGRRGDRGGFGRSTFTPPARRGDHGGLETFFHKIVMIRNILL